MIFDIDQEYVDSSLTISEGSEPTRPILGKRTCKEARYYTNKEKKADYVDLPVISLHIQYKKKEQKKQSKSKMTCTYPGCSKRFTRKVRLNAHMHLHYGTQPYQCSEPSCGKRFSERQNLKIHERIHTGEKPYLCSVDTCQKRFATKGNLLDHERRHANDR